MKINLYVDENDMRTDMMNFGRVHDLSEVAEDGEVEELLALNVLDYIYFCSIPEILGHWLKKIARKGEISIGGTSFPELTKAAYRGELPVEEYNALTYGSGYPDKKSISSLEWVRGFLTENGFQVTEARIDRIYYFVKGVRK